MSITVSKLDILDLNKLLYLANGLCSRDSEPAQNWQNQGCHSYCSREGQSLFQLPGKQNSDHRVIGFTLLLLYHGILHGKQCVINSFPLCSLLKVIISSLAMNRCIIRTSCACWVTCLRHGDNAHAVVVFSQIITYCSSHLIERAKQAVEQCFFPLFSVMKCLID